MSETKTYSSAMADATGYFSWIHDEIKDVIGTHVLEVGFGHGLFTRFIADDVDYLGVDYNTEDVRQAKTTFPALDFVQADLTAPNFGETVGGARFDTAISFNVLEHIEDDARAFQSLASTLKPGGHLVLLVPAMPRLYSSMDSAAGHFRRYTIEAVRQLAATTNLREVRTKYLNPIGAFGWWVNKLMKPADLDSPGINRQIAIFDKWILPISRAMNPLTHKLAGLSVLAVYTND